MGKSYRINELLYAKKYKEFLITREDISSLDEGFKDGRRNGTAKTTVARLFAEIMRDEKVLSTGRFVEVGRADLVGTHVGETAPLVKKRFKEAQ